jgi:ketosteroid isomerase-like protein
MHRTLTALIALTLTLFIGGAAMAQNTETEIRNKATVQASFDAWRAGAGGPFDLLSDEATWTIVGQSDASRTYPTKAAFLSEVIGPFNARMSVGIKPTIREIHADGDAVVIFFDAAGTARDGKPYANTYAWFFHMRDGKVVKASAFFDSVVFNDLWRRVTPQAKD